jgi:hypothetical protein
MEGQRMRHADHDYRRESWKTPEHSPDAKAKAQEPTYWRRSNG